MPSPQIAGERDGLLAAATDADPSHLSRQVRARPNDQLTERTPGEILKLPHRDHVDPNGMAGSKGFAADAIAGKFACAGVEVVADGAAAFGASAVFFAALATIL